MNETPISRQPTPTSLQAIVISSLGRLGDPDRVRRSSRSTAARLFSRWYTGLRGGKHLVVVVVSDVSGHRHWVVTAYMTGKLVGGEIEWSRD